jgi:hypothetical protein
MEIDELVAGRLNLVGEVWRFYATFAVLLVRYGPEVAVRVMLRVSSIIVRLSANTGRGA